MAYLYISALAIGCYWGLVPTGLPGLHLPDHLIASIGHFLEGDEALAEGHPEVVPVVAWKSSSEQKAARSSGLQRP